MAGTASTRKPNKQEASFLDKTAKALRKIRDKAVNNSRTRKENPATTHRPNLRRTKKDIMKDLTQ